MDIKFIGSGPAAKAILYYITDYITKTQLQAHVAYAALELAVGRLGEYDPNVDDYTVRARRLLQKCAHAMIAKQELSAQQVVSYLMGYEDHFTSHKFNSLYWTGFEKFINDEDPSPECYRPRVENSAPVAQSDEMESENERGLTGSEEQSDLATAIHSVPAATSAETDETDGGAVDEITLVFDDAGRPLPSETQVADYQSRGEALKDVCV
ncbi:ATP-dependent DNA helicase [Mycena venus]|uniref:ATP-dependent DNA helicase n=1 Tax=Mycena venus TaxID=2733690 RepID=A0A8H6Z382_9AGAR|nr:ATP-dependent DNA helicase [Mycena venus]